LTVAVSVEEKMVTNGGESGTPSYKQVMVDRGKGPRHWFRRTAENHLRIRIGKESGE